MTTPTEPEALAPAEVARQMLAHLDDCDRIGKFASIETMHIRQICEALTTSPAVLGGEGREPTDEMCRAGASVWLGGGGVHGMSDEWYSRMRKTWVAMFDAAAS